MFWLVRRGEPGLVRLCGLAFLLEVLLVGGYFIIEERYVVDWLPCFVFAYAVFLREAATRFPLRGRAEDLATALIFCTAVSSIVTVSSTLSAIPLSGPALSSEYKDDWTRRFRAVDAHLGRSRGH